MAASDRQGFAAGKLTGTDVILHGGKQGNPKLSQQGFRRLEIAAISSPGVSMTLEMASTVAVGAAITL
ncbi:MAG: hypothetical protein K9M97_09015 [Akkermansiaceae bacterium]|nr:hypothetical protein [Akkermansiaceae bacterium]